MIMADQDFDQHYDVILTGTDLCSAILSAALARVGKKVLHLDSDRHYGKEWRSLKLSEILLWKLKQSTTPDPEKVIENKIDVTKEILIPCHRPNLFSNVETDFPIFQDQVQYEKFFKYLLKDKCTPEFLNEFHECFVKINNDIKTVNEAVDLFEKFKDNHLAYNRIDNMFLFDLCPRFLISNEKMVQILIDSTITRYIEFKKVSRHLTPIQNEKSCEIVEVPCTRSDIFVSRIISPMEKRYLMSFLEKCYHFERNKQWYADFIGKPFNEFLKNLKLTEKLQKFITNTLLMSSEPINTEEALKKIELFLRSFGRFCDRPFLFPLFGSEDIIQAFCRYGAVWGGVYCLGVSINGLVTDPEFKKCSSIIVNESRTNCDYLITDYRMPKLEYETINVKKISRAIILNTKSIKNIDNENGDLSFIFLPPDFTGGPSVYCFESDYSSRVCPRNFYLQYFWCDSIQETAKQDLEPVIKKILSIENEQAIKSSDFPEELQSKILISIFYNYLNESINYKQLPKNIELVSPPINELNYENVVSEAERIFKKFYPDEEFFPKSESDSNPNEETPNPLDDIEDSFLNSSDEK